MYSQLLNRLFTLNQALGMKLGLDVVKKCHALMGMPGTCYPVIHIAGTNGKGSVATKIAKGLSLSGYKTGLFTSPHIATFRERIQIDGIMINEKAVVKHLSHCFKIVDLHEVKPTFFELTTVLALYYFAQEQIDVLVLETGLGGRLDATNILSPILSIITSISLDHVEYLGTTLASIAKEKGGIIKPNTPVILGKSAAAQNVLLDIARKENAPVILCANDESVEENLETLAKTALLLLQKTFLKITTRAIAIGIKAMPPCRFEKHLIQNKKVILDVAHNVASIQTLVDKLHFLKKENTPIGFLIGFARDKDISAMLRLLSKQKVQCFYPICPENHTRLISQTALAHHLKALQLPLQVCPTIKESVIESLNHCEIVVATGSFYIMHDVQIALGIAENSADGFSSF